jgi:gliding motility-associated-like protein
MRTTVFTYVWIAVSLSCFLGSRLCAQTIGGQFMGGEFRYERVGSSGNATSYKITFYLYRNCNSFAELEIPEVFFYNSGNSQPPTKVFRLKLTQTNKTRLQANTQENCVFNLPAVCSDKIEFTGFIELPHDPNGYLIYVSSCCRNNGQKNIFPESWTGGIELIGGAPEPGQALTYYERIPPESILNNSPFTSNDSALVGCVGKPFKYKLSCVDPDGDDLIFDFSEATGKTEVGTVVLRPVTYQNGYSSYEPFGIGSTITLNRSTGELSGVPTITGVFTVALDISEIRNGQKIAVHRKEIELNIGTCKASLNPSSVTCSTPTVAFAGHANNPALSYHWDFGVPNVQSDTSISPYPIFTYPAAGTYTVTMVITNEKGCKDTARTMAGVFPDLKVDFDWKTPVCNGTPIQLFDRSSFPSSQITSYQWNYISRNGSVVFSRQKDPLFGYQFNDTVPVGYSIMLTVNTNRGCSAVITKVPFVYPIPEAYLGKDTTVSSDLGYEIPLKPSTQNKYLWTPSTGVSDTRIANPLIKGTSNQCYQLKVWGKDSVCTNTDNICISYAKGPDVYVASGFTPNGDWLNDKLSFKAVQVQVGSFEIFNRSGQRVFSSNTELKGWDGKVKGVLQDTGVYVWVVKGKGPGGVTFTKTGTVLLIR